MIRVAAFTGGRTAPSARFRVRQLIPALRESGVDVREWPAPLGTFPPPSWSLRPAWAVGALGARLPGIARSYACQVTLLQREMLSTFVTLEPLTRRPRVLDVDDAIFLSRGGRFAERLARSCDSVVCGNSYLAERFGAWNARVEILPTGVDTAHYAPGPRRGTPDGPVIGWMGTSSNLPYLYAIETALARVLRERPDARILVVADRAPRFLELPADRVEYRRWRADIEVDVLRATTVGVMPLKDSPWERGKCSLKMLLYMACEVPVVVSPVGTNVEVLARGDVGLGARSDNDWVEALIRLLGDGSERARMGGNGRRVVREHYSVERIAPRLADHLRTIAG